MQHGEKPEAALAAIIAVVAGLIDWLLGRLTNDDDLVGDRSIAYTRAGLQALNGRDTLLDFTSARPALAAHYAERVYASGPRTGPLRLLAHPPGRRRPEEVPRRHLQLRPRPGRMLRQAVLRLPEPGRCRLPAIGGDPERARLRRLHMGTPIAAPPEDRPRRSFTRIPGDGARTVLPWPTTGVPPT